MTDQFLIGNYRNFVYLVSSDGQSLVVDPQSDLTPWQARLKELGSKLVGVLLTHTHWDHIAGVPAIADQYPDVPFYVHAKDAARLKSAPEAVRSRIRLIEDGGKVSVGQIEIDVLHTPGHSAGECCYLIQTEPPQLFTGDTVFVGDVGRTDLESGSTTELFHTLQRLKKLPPATIIYPGHDYGRAPTSTVARESEHSAAFKCKTIGELDALP